MFVILFPLEIDWVTEIDINGNKWWCKIGAVVLICKHLRFKNIIYDELEFGMSIEISIEIIFGNNVMQWQSNIMDYKLVLPCLVYVLLSSWPEVKCNVQFNWII